MDNISGNTKNWCGIENTKPVIAKEIKEVDFPELDIKLSNFIKYYNYKPSNELSSVILSLETAIRNYERITN